MADTEKIKRSYVADANVNYTLLLPGWYGTAIITGSSNTIDIDLGFTAFSNSNPARPQSVKPRFIWMQGNTTGLRRKILAGSKSAGHYTALGWTVILPKQDGTTETFTAVARIGERILRSGLYAA